VVKPYFLEVIAVLFSIGIGKVESANLLKSNKNKREGV